MLFRKQKEVNHLKKVEVASRNIVNAVVTVVGNLAQVGAVVIVVVTEVVTEVVTGAIVLPVQLLVPVEATNHGATVNWATEAAVLQAEAAEVIAEAQAVVTRKDIKISYLKDNSPYLTDPVAPSDGVGSFKNR